MVTVGVSVPSHIYYFFINGFGDGGDFLVQGTRVEINEAVIENPQLVNEDPYGKGWLLKVRPHDKALTGLLNADEYTKVVASEAH